MNMLTHWCKNMEDSCWLMILNLFLFLNMSNYVFVTRFCKTSMHLSLQYWWLSWRS